MHRVAHVGVDLHQTAVDRKCSARRANRWHDVYLKSMLLMVFHLSTLALSKAVFVFKTKLYY